MHRIFSVALAFLFVLISNAQSSGTPGESLQRPRLVVGLVVDQMRWDFLYRYYDRYAANGGFKKMLNQGFSCENTFIPYAPTVTAPGHTTIYTGAVPAIHGITGNSWWDVAAQADVYCTGDKTVQSVGGAPAQGMQSPKNMLVTTICDELRLATNFQSKVIGIAIKDRGGILPAGHSANGAYWYDNTSGNWITSTYYMNDLPQWVKDLNAKKLADKYYEEGWNTLYPINTYTQSTADDKPYESKGFGTGFPYDLKRFIGRSYAVLPSTPHGNTFTLDIAKAAIEGEKLGVDAVPDFLAISFSSPDYIGHGFGPNSIEQEDDFLRLDKDLGDFFTYLDSKIGQGQYLVFLSADHGAAHVPAFMKENKLPAGNFDDLKAVEEVNLLLKEKFGQPEIVIGSVNYQLILDNNLIAAKKLNRNDIMDTVINFFSRKNGVAMAFDLKKISDAPLPTEVRQMLINGFYAARGGDIQMVLQPNWIEGFLNTGTTHGLWNPYDSHIPLLWYGWGIKTGKLNRTTYMTDIAPTLAALLKIQMPSGSTGQVIAEVIK
jgi:predicted AlkP superfamily pyrophosphatase or phosphodiesterase